jgi:hypothetical protein
MQSQAQGRARFRRLLAVAGCVALLGAAAGCASKVDQKAPEQKAAAAKELSAPAQRHHFRGPVQNVIDTVYAHAELTSEQFDHVGAIETDLEENSPGCEELHDKFKTSAVAIVRSGTANSEEFDQSVSEAVGVIEQRLQHETDALEEIHGVLEPWQRAKVAAALRVKIADKFGPPPEAKRHREGFSRFASYLVLSKLQLDQLATIKKELIGEKQRLRPSREELTALVDAFESDDFSKPLDEFREKKIALLHARVADAGKRADSVLSIFTPEQRELLADLILEGPGKVLLGEDPTISPREVPTRAP